MGNLTVKHPAPLNGQGGLVRPFWDYLLISRDEEISIRL